LVANSSLKKGNSMLDTKRLKKYARKYKAMKVMDAFVKKLRKELDTEAPGLIDHLVDCETNVLSLKNGDTLTIKREIWPKILVKDENDVGDKVKVVKALRAAGLNEIVTKETYQVQKLASYLRELAKGEQPLPEPLVGIIESNSVPKLIVKTFK
jgi:hypothetical protein